MAEIGVCWDCGYEGPTIIDEGGEDEGSMILCEDRVACTQRVNEEWETAHSGKKED